MAGEVGGAVSGVVGVVAAAGAIRKPVLLGIEGAGIAGKGMVERLAVGALLGGLYGAAVGGVIGGTVRAISHEPPVSREPAGSTR